jgi:low temperature requirement protein LtrA
MMCRKRYDDNLYRISFQGHVLETILGQSWFNVMLLTKVISYIEMFEFVSCIILWRMLFDTEKYKAVHFKHKKKWNLQGQCADLYEEKVVWL